MADAIDHHLERLDHLQGIVQRLAGNSFLIKGWTVTLVSAILGFALKDGGATAQLAYLALVPILLFWGLDGYYLAAERQVRDLYNDGAAALNAVSSSSTAPALPDPRIRPAPVGYHRWLSASSTAATVLLYLLLAFCALAVASGAFGRAAKLMVFDV
jgi:hypothetical protein